MQNGVASRVNQLKELSPQARLRIIQFLKQYYEGPSLSR